MRPRGRGRGSAGVRLAMHYYAFYEAYCDEEDTWSKDGKKATQEVNHIICDYLLRKINGASREEAIRKTDLLRKEIMEQMDTLVALTDEFKIYEYVLNRIEYRFVDERMQTDDEEFAKDILRWIFDTEDNLIINEKIKEVIGQLPVRITRQKYFELLKDSIQVYLGAEKSSLDTYLYILRVSATLFKKEGLKSRYPNLWEKKELLSRFEFNEITKEDYEKAKSLLQAATITLETETTVYMGLQEIVNEVYAMLLSYPYAGMAFSEQKTAGDAAYKVISDINAAFLADKKEDILQSMTDCFTDMEGVQEEMSEEISQMEDALYEVNSKHKPLAESLMLNQSLQVLLLTQKLLSNSLFIDLEESDNGEMKADEALIAREGDLLVEELSALFADNHKMVSRAIIANTISKMPVFFDDHKQVMDYVLYSLERCSDIYEKAACFEIINELMSE
jgi:hypothetical protein